MAFFRWLANLLADKIQCSACKGSAHYSRIWGRYSIYECKCGTTTKIKTYDL